MIFDWNDKAVIAKVKEAVHSVSRDGANMIASDARTLCPWETGELATSIEVKQSKFEGGGFYVQAQGPGNYHRYHASFVELGTFKDEAQPYLRPAMKKNERKIKKDYQDALDKL